MTKTDDTQQAVEYTPGPWDYDMRTTSSPRTKAAGILVHRTSPMIAPQRLLRDACNIL